MAILAEKVMLRNCLYTHSLQNMRLKNFMNVYNIMVVKFLGYLLMDSESVTTHLDIPKLYFMSIEYSL